MVGGGVVSGGLLGPRAYFREFSRKFPENFFPGNIIIMNFFPPKGYPLAFFLAGKKNVFRIFSTKGESFVNFFRGFFFMIFFHTRGVLC